MATRARFRGEDGGVIDEGLALHFPGPHSYTGEDMLELHGHGSPVALRLVLRACVCAGARLAEPGEFTRRAFLNGKLDLMQAESVADLIDASTEKAARSAARSLAGGFSKEIERLATDIKELRARVEAVLDFPEDDVDAVPELGARLESLYDGVLRIRAAARQGSLLRSGLRVVLAGEPNVGKSSLLNRLAEEERAIVTDIPGTTRDALHETIQIEGVPVHLVDTAGLRESADPIEGMGIARAWQEIERADVVVLVADAREGLTDTSRNIRGRFPGAGRTITVLNKIDLTAQDPETAHGESGASVSLSAKTGEGIDLLRHELLRAAGWQEAAEDVGIARERHVLALDDARFHLGRAARTMDHLELVGEELRLAQESLGEITGELGSEELLGEIFSRFCIGK
ncbi:MAG: tRNA uridine-5-carboxymethylaminomethyl(34) synthesis GTPase MnmE [Rhodocyclaceae bacterium]